MWRERKRGRLKFQWAIRFWHFDVPGALRCHAGNSYLFLDSAAAEKGTGTALRLHGRGGDCEVVRQRRGISAVFLPGIFNYMLQTSSQWKGTIFHLFHCAYGTWHQRWKVHRVVKSSSDWLLQTYYAMGMCVEQIITNGLKVRAYVQFIALSSIMSMWEVT